MCSKMFSKVLASCVLFLALSGLTNADAGTWMVMNNDGNVTCLIVQMNIKVNFTYNLNDNKTSKTVEYSIPINETTVDQKESQCSDGVDTLKVSWNEGNNFFMRFEQNKTNNMYDLKQFNVTINTTSIFNDSLANQTVVIAYNNQNDYNKPDGYAYHCNREQTLNATNGAITVGKVQYEAFKNDNSKKFSNAKDCDSNVSPDIVPIAVGISLIALIVVVLIAYIVGRRRQQARGYLNIM